MRYYKLIIGSAVCLISLVITFYFYLVYNNNLDTSKPSAEVIQQALDKSINWILTNQDELIYINNPALWWFIDESASIINNPELATLVMRYRRDILNENSVWTGYFGTNPPFTYVYGALDYMEEYQKFFVYGLTCDSELGEEQAIKDQLEINYCNWRPYYSSCSTHQLMGIRLLQIKNCGNQKLYNNLSDDLANKIEHQLIWDPRVGDVYIQRVLMLVESGHRNKVKPIWIRNILGHQLEDGAWSKFVTLISFRANYYLGFTYKFISIDKPEPDFHTTAQAIYLLSLLNTQDYSLRDN
jgi:hypothetical protein